MPNRGNSGSRAIDGSGAGNGSTTQGYRPGYADPSPGAPLAGSSTAQTVLAQLQHGWSPQQVAGRLAREQHRPVISHETIYRFIYAQMARKTEYVREDDRRRKAQG